MLEEPSGDDKHSGGVSSLLDGIHDGLTSAAANAVAASRLDARVPRPPAIETLQGRIPGLSLESYAGCGGMGFVYKARRARLERTEAVKILRDDAGFGPDGRRRLEREGKILAQLRHEGIVACHDVGTIAGSDTGYLVMDWLEGCDLATLMNARHRAGRGPLALGEALEIVIQAGRAVAVAHAAGIFHRDLKPANLMLLEPTADFASGGLPPVTDIRVKVLDFGLAVQMPPGAGPLLPTLVACTTEYAAPEQRNGGPIDARVDVYNLAATFYHLLTGHLPAAGARRASLLVGVDGTVDDLFDRAMHPVPERRPSTMTAFVEELERLRSGIGSVTRPPMLLCLRGAPGETPAQWLERAGEIVRASPGVDLSKTAGPADSIWVRACTPGTGAACALRWLRLDQDHRAGADHEETAETAGRLADLAEAGQFFVAGRLFDQIRTDGLRDPRDPEGRTARFFVHGRYTWPALESGEEPTEVVGQICPAGNWGKDPFRSPANPAGGAASLGEDDTWHTGEQMAGGEPVPHCPGWVLIEKLGQGGYGEVWLASHPDHARPRAFKFCHDALRLDSFHRESEALAALANAYPDETGFSYLLEKQFGDVPFSLQTEYCPLGNLLGWLESVGGAKAVPLHRRVELLARVARLAAKAHVAGIIHRDLKPSNILILPGDEKDPWSVRPRLADFGLSGRDDLYRPEAAETDAALAAPTQSGLLSGSRMYRALEAHTSTQSDVFALGVILYQLAANRFDTGPGQGFGRRIRHPLLRRDISAAISQEPDERPSARRLAERLDTLKGRTAWLVAWQAGSLVALAAVCLFIFKYVKAVNERDAASHKAAEQARELNEVNRKQSELFQSILQTYSHDPVTLNFAEAARQQIVRYKFKIASQTEKLTATDLQEQLRQFGILDGFLQNVHRPSDLDTRIQFADACLDAATRGLKTHKDRIYFSRQVVQYAQRCGFLRTEQTPALAPEDIRAYFEPGLDAGRYVADHLGTDLDDLDSLVVLLQNVAILDEKSGRLKRAVEEWSESLSRTARAASYKDYDSRASASLETAAQKATEALKRLQG